MSQGEIIESMRARAEKAAAVVSSAATLEEAIAYAVNLTAEEGGTTLAAPGMDDAAREALGKACGEKGITLLDSPLRDKMTRIHTAFTWADRGIADTGTLVLNSNSEELRLATMLSETHVAVLPTDKVVPSMDELEGYMTDHFKNGAGYVAFITGPSRTADIERILTIGVHGPERLHILLAENLDGGEK
ncbi:lactate utilization protein [Desulfoluna sp.]|uniref:lactate utilization protein n=1 Tax=Desulfoluna sp. TaxID=2045199 RepID=UPI00261F5947|nr:lactate utilization protein [Desulfoluna sp.]